MQTLVSAWIKTRPQEFLGYMELQTVDQYCDGTVMPLQGEMDNVSLSALNGILISPAGIGLELSYLDRSDGSDSATVHLFGPVIGNEGVAVAVMRLLYRPSVQDAPLCPHWLTLFQWTLRSALHGARHLSAGPFASLGAYVLPICQPSPPGASMGPGRRRFHDRDPRLVFCHARPRMEVGSELRVRLFCPARSAPTMRSSNGVAVRPHFSATSAGVEPLCRHHACYPCASARPDSPGARDTARAPRVRKRSVKLSARSHRPLQTFSLATRA